MTKPRTPVKKRRTGKPRRGPMRSKAYREWLWFQRCVVCLHWCSCWMTSDPCHTQNNGMSSKGPDSSCVPLCRKHHMEYDVGRAAFEKKYEVDMKALAAEHYQRFLKETA